MADPTWQMSLDYLQSLHEVPVALSNAAVLAQARGRWQHMVVARTSMHDLLFTLPGEDYPFRSSVRVRWTSGSSPVITRQDNQVLDEKPVDRAGLDTELDRALEWLTSPALVCRHCGRLVGISADQLRSSSGCTTAASTTCSSTIRSTQTRSAPPAVARRRVSLPINGLKSRETASSRR